MVKLANENTTCVRQVPCRLLALSGHKASSALVVTVRMFRSGGKGVGNGDEKNILETTVVSERTLAQAQKLK